MMLTLFVSACSSSGEQSVEIAPELGAEPEITNPGVESEAAIEEDKGYKVVGTVKYNDGELLGSVEVGGGSSDNTVKNSEDKELVTFCPVFNASHRMISSVF